MHCPRFLENLTTDELVRRFSWKYTKLARDFEQHEEASDIALNRAHSSSRRVRLVQSAQAANIAASAARHMLYELASARIQMCDDALRRWLIERIGNFNWREAFAHSLAVSR